MLWIKWFNNSSEWNNYNPRNFNNSLFRKFEITDGTKTVLEHLEALILPWARGFVIVTSVHIWATVQVRRWVTCVTSRAWACGQLTCRPWPWLEGRQVRLAHGVASKTQTMAARLHGNLKIQYHHEINLIHLHPINRTNGNITDQWSLNINIDIYVRKWSS